MKLFEIDLCNIIKVALLGKEHLVPPTSHKERTIDVYIMYLVTNGTLQLENNGEKLILERGDVYIFNKGDYQKPLFSTDCEYYYIHFDADLLVVDIEFNDYLDYIKNKNISFRKTAVYGFDKYDKLKVGIMQKMHIDGNNFNYIADRLQENRTNLRINTFEERVNISHNLANVFIKLEKYCEGSFILDNKSNRIYNTVKDIADYINANYSKDINSADIENKFALNYDYANRIFKRVMGESIVKYRNRHRIERAKYLLLNTQMSIDEIAFSVGFSDKYYFCRFFTKTEGVSPLSFKSREIDYVL